MKHLAIIMDGNRRYAKKQLFSSPTKGHAAGFENLKDIIPEVAKLDIKYFTVWALSNDNLKKRSQSEISGLFKILLKAKELLPLIQKENICFQTIGDIEALPQDVQDTLQELEKASENSNGLIFTVALNYGGQDEIIRGINKALKSGVSSITAESFTDYLDNPDLPPADLIIRTGGDNRHSGFLLYTSAYSEYFFSNKLWPEFSSEDLNQAIKSFNSSKRNFGK